jgi:hypothetical protein
MVYAGTEETWTKKEASAPSSRSRSHDESPITNNCLVEGLGLLGITGDNPPAPSVIPPTFPQFYWLERPYVISVVKW